MSKLQIDFRVVKNDGSYEDLLFSFSSLDVNIITNSDYFLGHPLYAVYFNFNKDAYSEDFVKRIYFRFFVSNVFLKLNTLPVKSSFYMPIEVFDEGTGYLHFQNIDKDKFFCEYGYIFYSTKSGVDLFSLEHQNMENIKLNNTRNKTVMHPLSEINSELSSIISSFDQEIVQLSENKSKKL